MSAERLLHDLVVATREAGPPSAPVEAKDALRAARGACDGAVPVSPSRCGAARPLGLGCLGDAGGLGDPGDLAGARAAIDRVLVSTSAAG